MLQNFNEHQNLRTATQVVYDNVQFPNGFGNFLEAIQIENLTSVEPSCMLIHGGYTWINEVAAGGIRLTTSKHPYVRDREAGQVVIEGQRDSLDIIQNILTRHGAVYEGSTKSTIPVHVEYHDTLNPVLWEESEDGYVLRPDIQEALEQASEAFYEYLGLPDLPIEDITITGSSANFNWTSSSDLDLHIIVDMKKAEKKYGKLVEEYFEAQKKLWNDLRDITIKGIPIEFYIQSTTETHDSTGVYSLKDEEWVVTPKHEPPDIDNNAVTSKVHEWTKTITTAIKYYEKPQQLEVVMKKLRDMRKAGLSEAGEFSTENLVFKSLRDKGLVDELADRYNELIDVELSLEEEEEDHDDPWTDLGYTRTRANIAPARQPQKRTRINLNVPYAHRETARRKGAKWDPGIRKWYMMVTPEELKQIPTAWR